MPTARPPETLPRRYGKYELLERIGEGGMAEVYRARLPGAAGFEKILVIKRILPHLAESPRFVRMFVNEAKIAAQIQHQNVVQVFELGESEEGELYIAMEHVHGLDLRALLELSAERVLRIPVWFSVHAMVQVLAGLAHAHELVSPDGQLLAVIHRDVTPSNVFVSYLGEVKLADFGVAKAVGPEPDAAETTHSGQLKGKISYAPPEQIHGEPLDGRADLFSAGVVLWEMLTQQRLFGGKADYETMLAICEAPRMPPSLYNPLVPPELDAIVLKALDASRENRPASARDMHAQLVRVLSHLRPRLLPSDIRHVIEVLTGRKPAHPQLGADLASLAPPPPDPMGEPEPVLLVNRRRPSPMPVPPAPRVEPDPALLSISQYDSDDDEEWSEPPTDLESILRAATPPPLDKGEAWRGSLTPTVRSPSRSSEPPPALRPSAEELPRWEPEPANAGSGPYFGAQPFYARTSDRLVRGPLEFGAFMRLLQAKSLPVLEVSADSLSWMPFETFIGLIGLESLSDERPRLKNVTLVGTLEETSVVALFARLARAGATGRLVIMTGASATARREIDMQRGAPIHVWTDRPDLQVPALAVRREVIARDRVPELMHLCLATGMAFDEALRTLTAGRGRHRPIFMRDRLVEAIRWRQGKYAFDASPVDGPPFSTSLLSSLVDHSSRAWNEAELALRLGHAANARLEPTADFEELARMLELNKLQEAMLQRLLEGKTVAQVAKKLGVSMAMALGWVLLETAALQIKK